jgi:hypothetical protein
VTLEEVHEVVMVLAAGFRRDLRGMTEDETRAWARVYHRGLMDLDAAEAHGAVERLIRTSVFLPTVAEIRSAVVTVAIGQQKRGAEAWGEVIASIGRHGRGHAPGEGWQLADPIAARVVDGLGWRALCDSENQVADRARFIEAYDALSSQGRTEAQASNGAAAAALPRRAPLALNQRWRAVLEGGPKMSDKEES